jgi:predicted amidohydrolase YtcJ
LDRQSKAAGGTGGAGRPDGALTGIFKDNAMVLISRRLPGKTVAQLGQALRAAMDYVAAQGVTSAHDMGALALSVQP